MALELSTAGVTVSYCIESTSGTRPTTGYTTIPGIKRIPDLNPEPNNLDVTDLSDTEYKRYIPGLKDLNGNVSFGANHTQAFMDTWGTLMTAYGTSSASGLAPWFQIVVPGLTKAFFFRGIPLDLGLSEMAVDEVLEIDAYVTPNKIEGWQTKST